MIDIHYEINMTTQVDLYHFLIECDNDFEPKLSSEVDLRNFSEKIYNHAVRFEAWNNRVLIGVLSVYLNDKESGIGFINHISILQKYRGHRISNTLMRNCLEYAKSKHFKYIRLEVSKRNHIGKSLYEKYGFTVEKENRNKLQMIKKLQLGVS